MDKPLMDILWDLLASEDANGCSEDRTGVAAEPVRLIRRYLRAHTSRSLSSRKPWQLEASTDGTVHLVLTSPAASAVADTLERGASGRHGLHIVAPLLTALRAVRGAAS